MNKKIKDFVSAQLANHVIANDIVAALPLMYHKEFPTKSDARTWLQEYMEENNLVPVKKQTKSSALKEWVLSHEDPFEIDKDSIKNKCEELEMKGGSIQYYINSYTLALDLASKLISPK